MELFQSQDNFIIVNGTHSLWCNRQDGRLQARIGVDLGEAWSLRCRGIVYGIIGKIQFFPGADWRLLVISKRTLLGNLPGGHEVYRIDRVAVLTLSANESPEFELDLCELHQKGGGVGGIENQQRGLGQTWSKIKTAASTLKEKNIKDKDLKDKEKLERRFVEELLKMFNDSDSFFYSPTGDLTNTLQRQFSGKYDQNEPLWRRCDKRFFWNVFMVQELLSAEDPVANRWVIPIIQGYCKIAHCVNTFEEDDGDEDEDKKVVPFPPEEFDLVLVSRRSLNRAGTRYRRRGVDDDGDVANYVETEQIICTSTHNVSFVQVRGSVPVYWSQPGYKYRPPPRIDRGPEENQAAFRKHFDHQLELYKNVAVINLVDQTGREKIISDVFLENVLTYNSPFLTYITFDFHEYCRGMRFENVSVLVESILEVIKEVRHCWTDAKGIICDQRGVFRVNCMDCLDRTNVVQAALARHIMEQQLKKLGKQLPDQILPASIRTAFQEMWASNGDAISRQYAGTAAMKGDFTRTGERRFTGVMKDGYNSANRYYLNRFKAAYRQTLIDVMLGNPMTEDIAALIAAMKNGPEEEQWTMEREECVAQLVQHCKQLLLTDEEECICGWALVDPFYSTDGGEVTQDQDVILLLTYHAYYVASYDDEAERITQYERIVLEDLEKIEIGFETSFKARHLFIRIHRRHQGITGYFHTLRTIQHRTADDARSVLLCIADAFASARASLELGLKVVECRLDRKKSKTPPSLIQISSKSRLNSWSKPSCRPKSNSATEGTANDSSLSALHRSRLRSLPTSLSDSCLAERRLEDLEDLKVSVASAPQSSGSSGYDDDEDDSEMVFSELHGTHRDIGLESTENGCFGAEGEAHFEGKTVNDQSGNRNFDLSLLEGGLLSEDEFFKQRGFVVGDEQLINLEEGDDGHRDKTAKKGNISREMTQEDNGCGQLGGEGFKEEGFEAGNEQLISFEEDDDDDESQRLRPTEGGNGLREVTQENVWYDPLKLESSDENGSEIKESKGTNTDEGHEITSEIYLDEVTRDKLPGIRQEKGKEEDFSTSGQESKSHIYLRNGEVNSGERRVSKGGKEEGHQINFEGSSGTMRVSYSSVELGSIADSSLNATNKRDKSPERRRFTGRFSGNRGLKIFANAQARGRTLIPELRSKLTSFSQQVRSRSPRMRPTLPNEQTSEQKTLRRKCRTKIIEL
ncbi:phosphatidylinositide phosphatase SAC2-like [Acropora millepora]|uniref:phosphatidylinositide phosphatase SAC2-like n=1 Tax=Acropora millepora TaxID=45264 RepID=UPI001CF22DFE|nr:phosphatidylinositide phosphatase SAC2-like [Acropora millepora]